MAPPSKANKFPGLKVFPRPLLLESTSKETFEHNEQNFELPPSRLYEVDKHSFTRNASEKFVRASCYKLPSKEAWINKFNFDFSLSFNPLYEDPVREETEEASPGPVPEQIPYLDKSSEKIFRCERCGGFVNPFFEFLDNNQKYKCNLCAMTNQVPDFYKNYLTNLAAQNMPAYETVSTVCDLLVDESYKMAKFERQNVLIALEFSVKSLSNGTFMHALNSLESTLESLGEDINIGICLFDSGVTFFDVDVDEETVGNICARVLN